MIILDLCLSFLTHKMQILKRHYDDEIWRNFKIFVKLTSSSNLAYFEVYVCRPVLYFHNAWFAKLEAYDERIQCWPRYKEISNIISFAYLNFIPQIFWLSRSFSKKLFFSEKSTYLGVIQNHNLTDLVKLAHFRLHGRSFNRYIDLFSHLLWIQRWLEIDTIVAFFNDRYIFGTRSWLQACLFAFNITAYFY